MKRIIITLQIFAISLTMASAQISFEGKQDANMMVYQLQDGTLQFIKTDLKDKKILIFDADNLLVNTIDLKIPKDHIVDDIRLLAVHNPGNNTQYNILYTCFYIDQKPIEDFTDPFAEQVYTLNVLDMDGNYLMQIHDTDSYQVLSTGNKSKLLVYKTERKGLRTDRFIEVYALGNK